MVSLLSRPAKAVSTSGTHHLGKHEPEDAGRHDAEQGKGQSTGGTA